MKKHAGKVLSLYITPQGNSHPIQCTSLSLEQDGVVGDKHYKSNIDRSILITSLESYALVEKNNIAIHYGLLGENLLVDYNPYSLPVGTQLSIGNTILEISQACPLCQHLSHIDKRLPKLLKGNRGIFAKVIQAGEIKENDLIHVGSK